MMAKQFDYEVKTTIRLNMHNPDAERNCHSKIERTGLSYYQAASDAAGRDSQ